MLSVILDASQLDDLGVWWNNGMGMGLKTGSGGQYKFYIII
jgi:hypothetical protein